MGATFLGGPFETCLFLESETASIDFLGGLPTDSVSLETVAWRCRSRISSVLVVICLRELL